MGSGPPYSVNTISYNPSSSSNYPPHPHHQVPPQPGMSRRPSNAGVAWNESHSVYNSPINQPPNNSPPGAPGPGSPMNASPSYPPNLAINLHHDQSVRGPYLSNRSPQMSPQHSLAHHAHHQHLSPTGQPASAGQGYYQSTGPNPAVSRTLAYSPSQYALHPLSANTAQHLGPAIATGGNSLLPQHHPTQPPHGYASHAPNPASALPPPPAYAAANPNNPSYYSHSAQAGLSSGSAHLPTHPPSLSIPNSATSASRQNLGASSSQSSSQPQPHTEQYYGSRSASGASSHRLRRNNESIGFRRVLRGSADLRPVVNSTPTERRLDPINGGYISPLKALTIHLASTYRLINPNFRYELSLNPRRVLTKPSKPAGNNGMDNEDSDYILYVNDILGGGGSEPGSESVETSGIRGGSGGGHKYLILDVLGQGTFGQVVKCQDMKTHQVVAVKVVKNKQAYFSQSMMEVTILELLNNTWDPENKHHILRMKDTFIHHNHLCLVFELLSSNLYELIKQNSFRGLSTSLVRVFTNQLLDALTVLNEAHLIHCDLKPENILLTSLSSPEIKVIDFGSACHERQTVYTYIQSRFYRSPEVILGLPYSSAIDMWSLGCICVELFLGLPLFPGTSEYNQITRIVEMLGMPPTYMLDVGKQTVQFFDVVEDELGEGRKAYKLKSLEQYSKEHNVQEQPSKRYFQQNTLEDIISQYPVIRKGMKPADLEKEKQNRIAFIDFVKGLLNLNPIERWSPQQARLHPFILGEPLREPYIPMKSAYHVTTGERVPELKTKAPSSSIQTVLETQPPTKTAHGSNHHSGTSGQPDNSVKRPYGGLPAAPARTAQKVYDAAAYSQLQAQQQAINAQAAAMRQHQAQVAQQSQNPYALPQDNRSTLAPPSLQAPSHSQHHNTAGPLTLHPQYSSNRLQVSHNPHSPNLGATAAAITIPHSYFNPRGGHLPGPLTAGSVPNSQPPVLPHNQVIYNPHLGSTGSNTMSTTTGRQRSGTLDQMDLVPPQLQKVQVDLLNYAGQSVTPVLRRDDQYEAWEQRQHGSGSGAMGNMAGVNRRPSHRANPQLDYLHEQAESSGDWSSAQRHSRFGNYPSSSNPPTYYTSTTQNNPHVIQQSRSQNTETQRNQTYSVLMDADGHSESGQEGSSDQLGYEVVTLDDYDHRDGGQAMAYLPMVPKPVATGHVRENRGELVGRLGGLAPISGSSKYAGEQSNDDRHSRSRGF